MLFAQVVAVAACAAASARAAGTAGVRIAHKWCGAGCSELRDLSALQQCGGLFELDLGDCKRLDSVEPLAGCVRLQRLSLANNIMVCARLLLNADC